jgi:hypothetical protein
MQEREKYQKIGVQNVGFQDELDAIVTTHMKNWENK